MTRCAKIGRTAGRTSIYLLLAALATGCASTPPPTAELDAADAALARARDLQAQSLAPVELGFAEKKRAAASVALEDRDNKLARTLAAQAEADAALAAAKSRAAAARAEVQRKTSENAALRSELLNEGGRP